MSDDSHEAQSKHAPLAPSRGPGKAAGSGQAEAASHEVAQTKSASPAPAATPAVPPPPVPPPASAPGAPVAGAPAAGLPTPSAATPAVPPPPGMTPPAVTPPSIAPPVPPPASPPGPQGPQPPLGRSPAGDAFVAALQANRYEPGPQPSPAPVAAPDGQGAFAEDAELDEKDEPQLTIVERLRRLPPALVILTAGSLGSVIFLLRSVTSHTTPVPVLMGAGVITGLIFGADAVISSIATWRSAVAGESGKALLLALVGGISYVISFGSFAGLVVMILVLNS